MATKRISERSVLESLPALSGEAGETNDKRRFLCIGPNCWGRGATAAEALKNAKREYPRFLGSGRMSKWIMFDVQGDAVLDDMGSICYAPVEGVKPHFEIGRYEGRQ